MHARDCIPEESQDGEMGTLQVYTAEELGHGDITLEFPLEFDMLNNGFDLCVDLGGMYVKLVELGEGAARFLLLAFREEPPRRLAEEKCARAEDECDGDLADDGCSPGPVGREPR